MAEKKIDPGYQKLRQDLAAGEIGTAYLLWGEETYLREHYLGRLVQALVPPAFAAFNHHRAEGKDMTVQRLAELVEAMPMMAERTVVQVTDWDLFRLPEEQREGLIALLEDLPPYCCLILVYDQVDYKPNRTMKKLCRAIQDHVTVARFEVQSRQSLVEWVGRRFRAAGKEIGRQEAEHLIFTCGSLMAGLIPEIEKVAAYARGPRVRREDIDAVAAPILEAQVFDMTNALSQGNFDRAAEILGSLLKLQQEPIMILSVMGRELRRLLTARVAIDTGRDKGWLMELWGMRSDYPAKLLLQSARRVSTAWCREAVDRCQALDLRMKSVTGADASGELRQFLMELAQGARA